MLFFTKAFCTVVTKSLSGHDDIYGRPLNFISRDCFAKNRETYVIGEDDEVMRCESFSSGQDLPQVLRRHEVDRPLSRLRDVEIVRVLQVIVVMNEKLNRKFPNQNFQLK